MISKRQWDKERRRLAGMTEINFKRKLAEIIEKRDNINSSRDEINVENYIS